MIFTIAVNPCCSFPCQHNGVCVADLDGDSYTCDCTWTGYYGTNCETRMVQIIIVQCPLISASIILLCAIVLHKPDSDTSQRIVFHDESKINAEVQVSGSGV